MNERNSIPNRPTQKQILNTHFRFPFPITSNFGPVSSVKRIHYYYEICVSQKMNEIIFAPQINLVHFIEFMFSAKLESLRFRRVYLRISNRIGKNGSEKKLLFLITGRLFHIFNNRNRLFD